MPRGWGRRRRRGRQLPRRRGKPAGMAGRGRGSPMSPTPHEPVSPPCVPHESPMAPSMLGHHQSKHVHAHPSILACWGPNQSCGLRLPDIVDLQPLGPSQQQVGQQACTGQVGEESSLAMGDPRRGVDLEGVHTHTHTHDQCC